MPQITYRGNLSSKTFPFVAENFGRTIIVPQYDHTYVKHALDPQDPDKDVGIPQLYYCHNVMPHSAGVQSVGYTQLIPGPEVVYAYRLLEFGSVSTSSRDVIPPELTISRNWKG